MEIKWIKISTDIFQNRKIKLLEKEKNGAKILLIWFKLLVLAGIINDGGQIYITKGVPYTDKQLAIEMGVSENLIRTSLELFKQYDMIARYENMLSIANWDKYQSVAGMEKVREQTRNRVAAYRNRQKEEDSNATVTLRNATDKNKNIDIRNIKEKSSYRKNLNQCLEHDYSGSELSDPRKEYINGN